MCNTGKAARSIKANQGQSRLGGSVKASQTPSFALTGGKNTANIYGSTS
jgi:hypothetical protein